MSDFNTFASRFEYVLKSLKVKKLTLAQKLEVSHTTIANIINESNSPSVDKIAKISTMYPQINIDWLITGRGSMYLNETQTPSLPVEEPSQVYESKKTNSEMDLMKEVNYLSKQVKQLEQIVELQNEKIKTLATELDTYRVDTRKKNAS